MLRSRGLLASSSSTKQFRHALCTRATARAQAASQHAPARLDGLVGLELDGLEVEHLRSIAQRPLRRSLVLVSDMDGTLIDGVPHEETADLHTRALRDLINANKASTSGSTSSPASTSTATSLHFVVNTGRTLKTYLEMAAHKQEVLPQPDALIGGVGTQLYWASPGDAGPSWEEDLGFRAHLLEGGCWRLDAVLATIAELERAFGTDRIRFHAGLDQTDLKQTFKAHADVFHQAAAMVEDRLGAQGVGHLLVKNLADDKPWGIIDVLPHRAGKGNATHYLLRKLGAHPSSAVACGDGPNDFQMLEAAAHAVVVSNSHSSVLDWAQRRQQQQQAGGGGSTVVVLATLPGAAGVMQGMEALGFI